MIYETVYLPWVDNTEGKPWKYSGSNWTDNPKYLGSPSSRMTTFWSENKTIRQWWKEKTKSNPQDFQKNILLVLSSESININDIKSLESAIQTTEDHKSDPSYFNRNNDVIGGIIKRKNRKPWNKGKTNIYSSSTIEAIKRGRANQSMGFWVTNGNDNLKIYNDNIPEGYTRGLYQRVIPEGGQPPN